MEKSFSERVAEAKAKVSSISPREANEYMLKNPHTLFIDPRDEQIFAPRQASFPRGP
ncbi:MAG: hypothetical protein WBM38_13435 [Arenicellales bacterium]|jgi:hypothetical protein